MSLTETGRHDLGIEHVAIAAADVPAAARLFGQLGMQPWHAEELEAEGIRSHQLASGDAVIEILEAVHDRAPLHRFSLSMAPACTTSASASTISRPRFGSYRASDSSW